MQYGTGYRCLGIGFWSLWLQVLRVGHTRMNLSKKAFQHTRAHTLGLIQDLGFESLMDAWTGLSARCFRASHYIPIMYLTFE